jgi:ketosteroid isomerase-like protein
MKRREFIAGTGMLIGSACAPSVLAADDDAAVKQAVEDFYSVYYVNLDKKKYRSLLTEDYLLLEDGQIMDADADIALMPAPDDGYKRIDKFDFRSVKLYGDIAYAVYFLKSEITDKKNGARSREYLESAILQRSGKGWRVALLHSTKIVKPGT